MINAKQSKNVFAQDSIDVIGMVIEVFPHATWITDGNSKIVVANVFAKDLEKLGLDLLYPEGDSCLSLGSDVVDFEHTVIKLNHGTNLKLHQVKIESQAVKRLKSATKQLDEILQTVAVG